MIRIFRHWRNIPREIWINVRARERGWQNMTIGTHEWAAKPLQEDPSYSMNLWKVTEHRKRHTTPVTAKVHKRIPVEHFQNPNYNLSWEIEVTMHRLHHASARYIRANVRLEL